MKRIKLVLKISCKSYPAVFPVFVEHHIKVPVYNYVILKGVIVQLYSDHFNDIVHTYLSSLNTILLYIIESVFFHFLKVALMQEPLQCRG